jgi:serine/threonine protein kinase
MSDSRSGQVESVGGEPSFALLVERITARFQAGEALALAELKQEHPEHADQLDEVWPALQALAKLDRSPGAGSPADDAEALGELGHFRIVREVGRGGMGVVYEAVQISLNRRVALKVLPFAATLDDRRIQRFKNEAQAAAHLHHSNIVPVHTVGCECGVYYYAMQFIDGQALAALIAELRQQQAGPAGDAAGPDQPCPAGADRADGNAVTPPVAALPTPCPGGAAYFRRVAQLGVQAAEGLDHAHQLGVIHRDVKPANLLVDTRGNLWITDFGLAHCISQAGLTLTGDLVGTLRYMSPEQALAQRDVADHRTDVYSLGATL